ncbi:MAG: protein translocase subunit SecF [Halieaceae bacterium]|nr:protein translocase subunit SecF [Halieaceae bacterium]
MSLINAESIDFMGQRRKVSYLSIALIAVSLLSLLFQGLNFSQEFNGGLSIQLGFPRNTSGESPVELVRQQLDQSGYEQATVVAFGSERDVLLRLANTDDPMLSDKLIEMLQARIDPGIELLSVEFVGPTAGAELRERGGLAVMLSLGMVALYTSFRFQAKFAAGAVLSLVHDIIITLGCFSLFQWEFNLTVLAACLAVIGYSINDTIVVFDRIREVFRMQRTLGPVEVINTAITGTLDRTLATSFTTLLVLFALRLFGGEQLFGFSMALIIGIGVGTYSSIYIAASILLTLNVQRTDLLPPQERQAELDELP